MALEDPTSVGLGTPTIPPEVMKVAQSGQPFHATLAPGETKPTFSPSLGLVAPPAPPTPNKAAAPSWDAIAGSVKYKAMDGAQRNIVRNQYFRDFVAPNVPTDKLESIKASFDADTAPSLIKRSGEMVRNTVDSVIGMFGNGSVMKDGQAPSTTVPVSSPYIRSMMAEQYEKLKPEQRAAHAAKIDPAKASPLQRAFLEVHNERQDLQSGRGVTPGDVLGAATVAGPALAADPRLARPGPTIAAAENPTGYRAAQIALQNPDKLADAMAAGPRIRDIIEGKIVQKTLEERIQQQMKVNPNLGRYDAETLARREVEQEQVGLRDPVREGGKPMSATFGESLRKGGKSLMLTWDFLADGLAGAVGADRTETQRILAESAKEFMAMRGDDRLMDAATKAEKRAKGNIIGTIARLPGELYKQDDALGLFANFMAEQLIPSIPGFAAGAAIGGPVGGLAANKALQSTMTSLATQAAVRAGLPMATAGAMGNGLAVVTAALGPNYAEGLQKFKGDELKARDYAVTKTLNEVPANALAGAFMGVKIGPNQLTNIIGQAFTQGTGGAAGAAQASVSVGEKVDPKELALEFVGEFAGAAPEVGMLALDGKSKEQTPGTRRADKSAEPMDANQVLSDIDRTANEAATSPLNDRPQPTDAQKEAGNYKKGHTVLQGLPLTIENPRGSKRSGVDSDGEAWENDMAHHYGYIKGTVGRDKDHLDVFVGPKPESGQVFIVDQIDPKTGKFDEHKIMLGFESQAEAEAGYRANYATDWQGMGKVTPASMDEFKQWVASGNTKRPFANQNTKMQPRDRDRAASVVQMANIANNPDFDRLNAAPTPTDGAPMVSAKDDVVGDMVVGRTDRVTFANGLKTPIQYAAIESDQVLASNTADGGVVPAYSDEGQPGTIKALTNGRAAGIKGAYQNGTADKYKAELVDRARDFGLDPGRVASMKTPMLVRLYSDRINQTTPNLGELSNAGGGMKMGPVEVAKADSIRLDSLEGLTPNKSGDFVGTANSGFIRKFLSSVPANDRNELLDAKGDLSSTGIRRMRGAIFAKAYGFGPVLDRMLESNDDNIRRVTQGMLIAAPKMADVQSRMERGDLNPDLNIIPDFVAAIEEFSRLREQDISVSEWLAQGDMLGRPFTDETVQIIQMLEEVSRSQSRVAEFLNNWAEQVESIGPADGGGLLDDVATAPPKRDLIGKKTNAKDLATKDASDSRAGQEAGQEPETAGGAAQGAEGEPDTLEAARAADRAAKRGDSPIAVDDSLTGNAAEVQRKHRDWVWNHLEEAIFLYRQANGNVLNTDEARKLSPDYNASPDSRSRLAAAVHEPSSWLVKEIYRRELAKPAPDGAYDAVVFTAGGTGAGKSTAIGGSQGAAEIFNSAQVVFDTNMNGTSSAVGKIEAALKAGKKVDIIYVYRGLRDSLVNGALRRAMNVDSESYGRSVPLVEHIKTHVGANQTIRELNDKYAGDDRVNFIYLDNTRGKSGAVPTTLEKIPVLRYNESLKSELEAVVEKEFQDGRISEALFEGTTGRLAAEIDRRSSQESERRSQAVEVPEGTATRTRQESQLDSSDPTETPADAGVSVYGATNRVVSLAAAEQARQVFRKSAGRLNAGLDPELAAAALKLATFHIEAGSRSFAQFSKAMVKDLGDAIKPYLKSLYDSVHQQDLFAGMDSPRVAGTQAKKLNPLTPAQQKAAAKSVPVIQKQAQFGFDFDAPAADNSSQGDSNASARPRDNQAQDAGTGTGPVPGSGKEGGAGGLFGRDGTRDEGRDSSGDGGDKGKGRQAGSPAPGKSAKAGRDREADARSDAERVGVSRKNTRNYRFGDDDLTAKGGAITRARMNLEAVKLLKQLEQSKKQATPAQQKVLGQFIGWGWPEIRNGIFPAQEWNIKPEWRELRDELRGLLTADEWKDASRSTQYAHFTSKAVVQSMWRAMERMGFTGGQILEPGMGIGNFPGLMPDAITRRSFYTGIEFEPVTGGIAAQLFPDEAILVESFVDSKLPRDYYDAAIGNPPFAAVRILADPEYAKNAFALHDYFFAKTMDRVRPGGLVAFVTSRYTMDKMGDKARTYLAERANLLGAIRLPQTAFKANAGTEVVTDVIFLQKRSDTVPDNGVAWLGVKAIDIDGQQVNINEYFAAHPEMVLGTHSTQGSMYSASEYTVIPREGDIEQHFDAAVENLPANVYSVVPGSKGAKDKAIEIDFNPKAEKEGNYYLSDDGTLMVIDGGVGKPAESVVPGGIKAKDLPILKDYVGLRDALKQAHFDQLTEGDWESSLKALQKEYKKFVGKHGLINQFKVVNVKVKQVDEETGTEVKVDAERLRYPLLSVIEDDPDYTLVMSLEKVDEEQRTVGEGDFLKGRVLNKPEARRVETVQDGLMVSLNDLGRVDLDYIADQAGAPKSTIIEVLGSAIYEDPGKGWVTSDEYLSGDIKQKIEEAKIAAKTHPRFQRNLDALTSIKPVQIPPSDITIGLGVHWVPPSDVVAFANEVTGLGVRVTYNEATRQWTVADTRGSMTAASISDFGTVKRPFFKLLDAALNKRQVKVMKWVKEGDKEKEVVDAEATEQANLKLQRIKEAFRNWVWKDPARTDRLVTKFNDDYNNLVDREFNGDHLQLPGVTLKFKPHPHVKRAVWRIIQQGNTYLAHAVGAGKTAEMVIAGMEMRRLGLVKKPTYVVPNHMLKQFAAEFQEIYPAAKIMVADEKQFHTENRRRFGARVALSNVDAVIITQSAFKLIDIDPKFKREMIDIEMGKLEAALESVDKQDRVKRRQIEQAIEKLEQKLAKAMSAEGKDKNIRLDQMGIDFLFVDEAHLYRKLSFASNMGNIKGINTDGSDYAFDLYIKTRYLEDKKPGRSLVMASGTPITNTVAELYTVQRFMNEGALVKRGLDDFDSWAAMFGTEKTDIESDPSGRYKPVTRFARFENAGALSQLFRDFADVLTSDMLGQLLSNRPKVKGGARSLVVTPQTPEMTAYQQVLKSRMTAIEKRKGPPEKGDDIILNVINDGRVSSIDMRYIYPNLPPNPGSKLNRMIASIADIYKATAKQEYIGKDGRTDPVKGSAQMVFADLGFGEGVMARGFNARRWFTDELVRQGVKRDQIAFMSDYKKSDDKLKLFRDVNGGKIRILVGSTKSMGTGVNAQKRLIAMHHLDSPWYPADLQQREGRIIRHGNQNKLVEIYAYATKGTYDQVMWGLLARKQGFIDQMMRGDRNLRSIEDVSEADQYAMATAMTAGDERAIMLAGLKADIGRLSRLEASHFDNQQSMRQRIGTERFYIEEWKKSLPTAEAQAKRVQDMTGENFRMTVDGKDLDERAEAGKALVAKFKAMTARAVTEEVQVGEFSGFPLIFKGISTRNSKGELVNYDASIELKRLPSTSTLVGDGNADPVGATMKAQNALSSVTAWPETLRASIARSQTAVDDFASRIGAPFEQAEELAAKRKEAEEIEAALVTTSKNSGPAEELALAAESRSFGSNMHPNSVRAAVRDAIEKLSVPVQIVSGPAQAQAMGVPAESGVAGLAYKDRVILIADGIRSPLHAQFVLWHEAFHAGFRRQFPEYADYAAALRGIGMKNRKLLQEASAWRKQNGDRWIQKFKDNGYTQQEAEEDTVLLSIEEALADRSGTEGNILKLQGWREFVAAIQRLLRKAGLDDLASWIESRTGAEALELIVAARDAAMGRSPAVPSGMVAAQSRQSVSGSVGGMDFDAFAQRFVESQPLDLFEHRRRIAEIKEEIEGDWQRGSSDDYSLTLGPDTIHAQLREENPAEYFDSDGDMTNAGSKRYNAIEDALVQKIAQDYVGPPSKKEVDFSDPAFAAQVLRDYLDAAGLGPNVVGGSGKSRSKYFVLGNGANIRISDHDLPDTYQNFSDIDIILPREDSDAALQKLKSAAASILRNAAPADSSDKGSRGTPESAGTQERSAVRAEESGSLEEPAQNDGAGGGRRKDTPDTTNKQPPAPHLEGPGTFGTESRTPAFKKWFGDSKVVDEEGKPLVVYHGTDSDFSRFNGKEGYFFGTKQVASDYAASAGGGNANPNVVPVYLSIQNPARDIDVEELTEKRIQRLIAQGYDGAIANEGSMDVEYVAFRPEQIKSAIGNNGDFDPSKASIVESRSDGFKPKPSSRGIIDPLFRMAGQPVADWITKPVVNWLVTTIGKGMPEIVKAGMVDKYGLAPAYIDRKDNMYVNQAAAAIKAKTMIEKMIGLTREQSRIAYLWMNNRDADALLNLLPDDQVALLRSIKEDITEMGREAVRLGQLSEDSFARNDMAYLNRTYMKHEETQLEKGTRARAIKILGSQYKGRGMRDYRDMGAVADTGWWGIRRQSGKADTDLSGQSFIRLEDRKADPATAQMFDGAQPGKIRAVRYWPAGAPIPTKYDGWIRAGTWEARYFDKSGQIGFWRDFTAQERDAMGEIDEVKYAVAKTLNLMTHDIETGRFLEWVGQTYAKADPDGLNVVNTRENLLFAYPKDTWVQVPDTKIKGTKINAYGKLANLYLPGPIWNDIRQVNQDRYQPFGEWYDSVLRGWKISKTALSPATHMNNIMANFVMADMHDVGTRDVLRAAATLLRDTPESKTIMERFEVSGANLGSFASQEIKRETLETLLVELRKETDKTGVGATVRMADVVASIMRRDWGRAAAGAADLKAARIGTWMIGKAMDTYQAEDTLFRLAAWLKATNDGMTDRDAGKLARESFLDYNITAPWVNAARASFLPFVAFSYRAIPMLAYTMAQKPWKLAKYMTVAGGLNAAAYALLGLSGDDEDRERALLPDEKSGKLWGVVPKLIRLPWNSEETGAPKFIDVRRWIPVGDIVDFGANNAAVPVPPMLFPGGPLWTIAEILANRSSFTGKDIANRDTDTTGEQIAKALGYAYRSYMPNLLGVPGVYATSGLLDAAKGKTDVFGRELSPTDALLSSVGIKIAGYPQDVLMRNLMLEFERQDRMLQAEAKNLMRQYNRNGIDKAELDRELAKIHAKRMERANALQKKVGAAR